MPTSRRPNPPSARWNGSTWSTVPSPSPAPTRNLLSDVDQRTVMSTAPNDGAGLLAVTALSPTKVPTAGTSTVFGVGWQYDARLSQVRHSAARVNFSSR